MIVLGFDNYDLLRKNIKDTGIEVLELSEVLADALGIKKIEGENIKEEEGDIFAEVEANKRLREELKEEDFYDESEGENKNGT